MSSLLIVTWLQILPEALPVGLLPDSAPSYAPSVVQVHLPWSWFAVSLLTRLLSFPKSAMNPTLSSPWMLSCNPCIKNTHGVKGSRRVGQHLSQEARWENTGKKKKWRNVRQMLSPAGRHFRKTGSNFDGVQAGPASCYKIKSIFWVSDQLKLVPLEIETLCKLIFI